MARPQKQPHERRSEQRKIRYTPDEIAQLEAQASIAGLTVTDLIRDVSLGTKVTRMPASVKAAKVDAANLLIAIDALTGQTKRIGNNVNQLAVAEHRGSDFAQWWADVGAELKLHIAELSRLTDQVGKAYDRSSS